MAVGEDSAGEDGGGHIGFFRMESWKCKILRWDGTTFEVEMSRLFSARWNESPRFHFSGVWDRGNGKA